MTPENADVHGRKDLHDAHTLATLLEDRLDGREKQQLISHLADCLECRETLAALVREADLFLRLGARLAFSR